MRVDALVAEKESTTQQLIRLEEDNTRLEQSRSQVQLQLDQSEATGVAKEELMAKLGAEASRKIARLQQQLDGALQMWSCAAGVD